MSNQFLKLRRSGVPGKIPSTSSIDYGEIALNTYDGVAYMKKSGSNGEEVVPIGSSSGSFSGSFIGNFSGSFTGDGSGLTNLPTQSFSTGSLLTTASFNAFTASYNTGSFTGSFSGSLYGTASWAQNAVTASYYNETDPVFTAVSGTFTTTASFNAFTSSYFNDSASFDTRILNNSSSTALLSSSFTSFSSSYNTGSFTGQFSGSFSGSGANLFGIPASGIVGLNLSQISSGSYSASISEAGLLVNNRVVADSFTGSLFGTASWATNALTSSKLSGFNLQLTNPPSNGDLLIYDSSTSAWENSKSLTGSYELSGSLTTRGQNIVCGSLIITDNSTISGSLIVGNNLTVFGTSTLLNLTSSQIDLGTSTLTFNVFSPAIRYGGIAVYDSGSTPTTGSGSFIYDTFSKDWISVNNYGSGVTSSAVLLGPETYNNQGSEIYLAQNTLPKGTGTAHLNDSSITDNGSVVTVNSNTTISGSLTIRENLVVLGSASVTYISESTLNIGTNLITVNTFDPGARFGGLAVIDSGSSPLVSASFLFDSVQDEFIFVHKGTAGGAITSSHFIVGPETYNDLGNETYLTANRIPKSIGNEHLNDSNISDNGSVVSINSNTQVTGSLIATAGVSGSFSGSGADLFGIPASGIVGLNLSQIASGSVSASISPNNGLQVNTNVTATSFTGSLFGTASWALTASVAVNGTTNDNFQQIFLLMGG